MEFGLASGYGFSLFAFDLNFRPPDFREVLLNMTPLQSLLLDLESVQRGINLFIFLSIAIAHSFCLAPSLSVPDSLSVCPSLIISPSVFLSLSLMDQLQLLFLLTVIR